MGSGVDNDVMALTALPNGDVIAAGRLTTAGGLAVGRIARGNGSSRPLASNRTADGRAANRRTDVLFIPARRPVL